MTGVLETDDNNDDDDDDDYNNNNNNNNNNGDNLLWGRSISGDLSPVITEIIAPGKVVAEAAESDWRCRSRTL